MEQEWLRYARTVVSNLEHQRACAIAGGSPAHPGVDATDLRWPGYLGERAELGRCVLAMGNVHRNFASGALTTAHRDRLVSATRGWRDGVVDDEAYLAATRAVYTAGLAGWTVGKHLRFVLRTLGLDVSALAYVNAARCQYPEVPPVLPGAAATKLRLQALCLRSFPLADLVAFLQPRLVLFTSTSAFDATEAAEVGSDTGRRRVCLHQLNGTLARELRLANVVLRVGTRREVWAEAVAGEW